MDEIDALVVRNETYGFYQLAEIPDARRLTEFYGQHYYEDSHQDRPAPPPAGSAQRTWLESCSFADLADDLAIYLPSGRLLDVGAGNGDLVAFLSARGYEAEGIDPSQKASEQARQRGCRVEQATLQSPHLAERHGEAFDGLLLMNVLEHLQDPIEGLERAKALLRPNGHLVVRVPNDFSEVQKAARESLGCPSWWIQSPDHISYFDRHSLTALLEGLGFEVLKTTADFPIDWFLLMGENYIASPELGPICHEKRCRFEQSLPGPTRRAMLEALASVGMGRNIIVHAKP